MAQGPAPEDGPAPDLLRRDFSAERSHLHWIADVTEFACEDGKLFLAGIRDLHDHSILGWSMGERQTTDLVVAALVMALGRREATSQLVHHADHGPQYTSLEFTNRLADWKVAGSYGSVGDAFDNAAMEAFWATLKKEVHHIWEPVAEPTRSELRTILFDYIEVCYNRSRHQPASTTAPPPRPTRPAEHPDLPKPRVHEIVATPESVGVVEPGGKRVLGYWTDNRSFRHDARPNNACVDGP